MMKASTLYVGANAIQCGHFAGASNKSCDRCAAEKTPDYLIRMAAHFVRRRTAETRVKDRTPMRCRCGHEKARVLSC